MTDTDIVTRLRNIDCTRGDVHDAADEIERLRKRLLAEENAYDIERRQNEHLQIDRNNLALEVERLRAEVKELTSFNSALQTEVNALRSVLDYKAKG